MRPALLSPFLFVAAATAQLQVTATGTLNVAYTSPGGPQSSSQPISGPLTTATLPTFATASLAVGLTTTLSLQAGPPPSGFPYYSLASGNALVTYTTGSPIAGVLTLQMNPTCLGSLPYVDVNDDGSNELDGAMGAATATIPVVLGQATVKVRIHATTMNVGFPNCAYAVSVTFSPTATNLQTVQLPCGPTLSATLRRPTATPATNGELKLHVGNMTGVVGVLFAGSILAPGPTCGPASNADASVLVTPSPAGVSIPLVIPPAVLGVFSLQYVDVVLPLQLRWSNAVQATLP
ncbi:MAG: hypothetical protein WAT39_18820 [Planctomycetota bacterium]